MRATRNRNAWIWVAFAALTLASVARAESGTQSARAYAHPVLQFLAGGHSAQATAARGVPRFALDRKSRQADGRPQQHVASTWMAMLPVLFIGLVSPLNQLSQRSVLCFGNVPAAPLLPPSFQRPPPLQAS
jgi:hypothetical protein